MAFESLADNLVADDANGVADVFVVTQPDGARRRVSLASDGTQANAASWGAAVSADGRFVAFASDASNLVPDDRNRAADVFVHDLETGQTVRVSVSSNGLEGNGHSAKSAGISPLPTRPALSADGRFVAFDSEATNLVADDANGCRDVFVHDRQTGQTVRVSLTSAGAEGSVPSWANPLWASSWGPDVSGDGRFVVFLSRALLVPEKTGIGTDVFLHDVQTGETLRVSACACGGDTEPNYTGASRASISGDGAVVAFESESTNVKPGFIDPNWSSDVFVFTREAGPADQDGDGVPDAEEQGPEGNDPLYDGDGDGVPDYLQDVVVSGFTHEGRHYYRSRVVNRPAMARVTACGVSDLDSLPDGVLLPFGAFEIEAYGAVESGGELLVELEFPMGVDFNSYYKYGRVPGSIEPRWHEFMYDGQSGAEIDGNRVLLHLVDGVRGDDDLEADGNLIDPGGPALAGPNAAPGLEVSPSTILLGADQTATTVSLKNRGGRPLVWAIPEPPPAWLKLDRMAGELGPGEASFVGMSADRTGLAPGRARHILGIRSGGGTRPIGIDLVIPFALEAGAERMGDCVVFTWHSEPGYAYRVESADSLVSAGWQAASETIVADSVLSSWTDCRSLPAKRFYRVVRSD